MTPAEITESEDEEQKLPSDKSMHSSNEGEQFDPSADIEEMISVEVDSDGNPLEMDEEGEKDYLSQYIDTRDQLNEHSQMAYDELSEGFESLDEDEIEIVSDSNS